MKRTEVENNKKSGERIILRIVLKTIVFFLAIYLAAYFFFLEHNDLIDEMIQKVILCILVLILIAIAIRIYSLVMGFRSIRKKFGSHVTDKVTNIMDTCKPLHRSFQPKKDHVVMLLHGFISSPVIFHDLIKELEENQIDYQAPLINGFGIKRIQLLFSLTEDEWIRQVTEMYDVLSSQYENVSVIGHSLGGALALYLSQIRPVAHLVLIAPAIFPSKSQKIHNFLAKNSILFRIVPWILPLLPVLDRVRDSLDEKALEKYYLYPVAPTRGAFNVLRLQSRIDVTKASYQTFDLFYGANDMAVDGEKIWDHLKVNNIVHRLHRFDYTGHNPLIDKEGDLAGWIIVYILNNQLAWPPSNYLSKSEAQSPKSSSTQNIPGSLAK